MIVSNRADAEQLDLLLRQEFGVVGLDCETEGINVKDDPPSGPKGRIVCWTVAGSFGSAFVWHNEETAPMAREVLPLCRVVGHNIYSFDYHMFRKEGIELRIVADTLRMHRLINTADGVNHKLKEVMKWWLPDIKPKGSFNELFSRRKPLGVETHELKQTWRTIGGERVPTLVGGDSTRISTARETIPLSEIPEKFPHLLSTLYEYALLDAVATLRLYHLFRERMKATKWSYPIITCSSSMSASGEMRAES